MMSYVLAILSLGALCGAWIVFQLWIARKMPDAPGIHRRCDGCDGREHCRHRHECEESDATHLEQVHA